jgi:hypothetical protein
MLYAFVGETISVVLKIVIPLPQPKPGLPPTAEIPTSGKRFNKNTGLVFKEFFLSVTYF